MSVEQILLRSMYYFRSIFQRSNYCRRSKCHTFGMVGAYISAKQLSAEQLSAEQLSAEQMSYLRSICRRSNCRRSKCRRSKCRRSNYGRSNCRRSKCRRSKCRRSKCLGAYVAEHLSHFSEQLSAEHMSPEHMSCHLDYSYNTPHQQAHQKNYVCLSNYISKITETARLPGTDRQSSVRTIASTVVT